MRKISGQFLGDKAANGLPGLPVDLQSMAKRVDHGIADNPALKRIAKAGEFRGASAIEALQRGIERDSTMKNVERAEALQMRTSGSPSST